MCRRPAPQAPAPSLVRMVAHQPVYVRSIHEVYIMLAETPGSRAGACVWAPPQLRVASPLHGFGFTVRHVRAFRQDARAHPVLPGEQRSEGHIPGPNQVRMEDEMARLTEEQQALLGAVVRRGIAAPWARLAGLM